MDQIFNVGHISAIASASDHHRFGHVASIFARFQFGVPVDAPISTPAVTDDIVGRGAVEVVSGDDDGVVLLAWIALLSFDDPGAVIKLPSFVRAHDGYHGTPVE